MPSRRRSRSKNLTNNLSDVQRRLRFLERRPVRTKLANRVVTKAAMGANSVGEDEVDFGTALVVLPGEDIDEVTGAIENPKDGLLVVDQSGASKVYDEEDGVFLDITDQNAQQAADDAAADALAAQLAADEAAADALLAQETADDAITAAGTASNLAVSAELSANGKNAVFRQTTEPTEQAGGAALKIGDIWFDHNTVQTPSGVTDSTGSKPRRYAGPGNTVDLRWPTFGLNYLAVTSIDADRIVTGTLIGRNIQTSSSGNRIEITNNDDIIFYSIQNVRFGTITPVGAGQGTGGDDTIFVDDGILIYGGSTAPNQGAVIFPSIVASGTEVGMYGGANYFLADSSRTFIGGPYHQNYADEIYLNSGYGSTNGNPWYISLSGPIYLDYSPSSSNWNGEPLRQGSGAPSTAGRGDGHIVFRYT